MGAFSRRDQAGIADDYERVFGLFPRLQERRTQKARHALGRRAADAGDRARADGRAQVLLLDEPSMGLAPVLVEQIFGIVKDINQPGHDHPAGRAERAHGAGHRHRGYVLQTGEIVLADVAERLAANPEVKKAYLGA